MAFFEFEGHRPSWVDQELYPFTDRWVTLPNEGTIHYVDEGPPEGTPSAGTIVFSHGTPSWSFEWRAAIKALSPRYRCIALDHLGFGLSERPMMQLQRGDVIPTEYTPGAHARRFGMFMEALRLQDVTLVVHDYGGPFALPFALDQPSRIRRLVVINSWMWSFQGDAHIERAARWLSGRLGLFLYRQMNASLTMITPRAYADRKKLTKRIHGQLLAPFTGIDSRERVLWVLAWSLLGWSEFYDYQWQRIGALADIPALILWGSKDPAFPPRYIARWREALPRAEVVELPVGHWPQEEAPQETAAALRAFLERYPQS
jgi:haloalkane dehalogenase